jgi:hypothetical protein
MIKYYIYDPITFRGIGMVESYNQPPNSTDKVPPYFENTPYPPPIDKYLFVQYYWQPPTLVYHWDVDTLAVTHEEYFIGSVRRGVYTPPEIPQTNTSAIFNHYHTVNSSPQITSAPQRGIYTFDPSEKSKLRYDTELGSWFIQQEMYPYSNEKATGGAPIISTHVDHPAGYLYGNPEQWANYLINSSDQVLEITDLFVVSAGFKTPNNPTGFTWKRPLLTASYDPITKLYSGYNFFNTNWGTGTSSMPPNWRDPDSIGKYRLNVDGSWTEVLDSGGLEFQKQLLIESLDRNRIEKLTGWSVSEQIGMLTYASEASAYLESGIIGPNLSQLASELGVSVQETSTYVLSRHTANPAARRAARVIKYRKQIEEATELSDLPALVDIEALSAGDT